MGSADRGSVHMSATDSMDMGHVSASTTAGGTTSSGMLAAHLLAALLNGLWPVRCVRVPRAVAGRLAVPLRLLLALPALPRRPRSDRAPRLLLLVHAITSRGPPLGIAVV